ncbi:filamentous hemagglutinin N-terminal domain-containing protein [Devosia sp. XK-2]|uniref:beta strand repeat-containing protein n=1 Tax=Devosia sp. XK-2 TaxID=3126689 RepID=UPI0030D46128
MRTSRLLAASLLMSTALVPLAWAQDILPSDGQFVAGSGTITADSQTMEINQISQAGIINWGEFSIGAGNQVHFNNGSGGTLNRVTGNIPSLINGGLSATGSVFLVNPSGVVVGTDGVVETGGSFVASTHDLSDADFLDGGSMTFSGTSTAGVVNAGTIRSAQGDIALIAREVANIGTLDAPNGMAGLAAGYQILLKDTADADGLLSVEIGGSDTSATNAGTITAASAEIRANGGNVYALAGNTDDVVKATGASTSGGRIFLTAGADGHVEATGTFEARRETPADAVSDGGDILLTGGTINANGRFDASAVGADGAGGNIVLYADETADVGGTFGARGGAGGVGGFVETSSAGTINYAGISVDTSSVGGMAGEWLIDPITLTVDAAAAATISTNLASTNVSLQTTDSTASGPGNQSAGDGDIIIDSGISWTSANTLTLNAYNNIAINAAINGQNGGLTLLAYGNSSTDAVGTISTGAGGAVDVGNFTLNRGVWEQVGAGLPDFSANGMDVRFGTFIRALGGDGTYTDPYALFDIYGLQGITTNDWRGRRSGDVSLYYELANDIDASATSSWNGGAGFAPVGLRGSLDGNGHGIDGLYINRPSQSNVALVSYWEDNYFTSGRALEIKDLTITNATVTGDSQVAILVGDTGGAEAHNMSNVAVSGTVQANSWGSGVVARYHGGIDQSIMTNVHADVSVTTTNGGGAAGGLVSIMREGLTISNSSSKGTISGGNVGGLVGTVDDDNNRIENSYSTATVIADGAFREAGGLVGEAEDIAISNSYFAGQVLGTNGASAGGLVGQADRNTVIENAFVTGLVEAEGDVGALVGQAADNSVSITDSTWDTDTTGQSEAIGYSGFSTPTVTNTNGLATSEMQGTLALDGVSLDSGIWGTGSGLYPYFNWEYATAPEAISGTVYTDAGNTAWSGAGIGAISGGNLLGTASTGANGYYYILTPSGSIDPSGALAFLDGESTQAAAFGDSVSGTGIAGLDMYGTSLNLVTGSASLSGTVADLSTTLGSYSDTDLDFIDASATQLTTNGYGLYVEAATDYLLDQDLTSGGDLSLTSGGAFSIDADRALRSTNAGSILLNSGIIWNGTGTLTLTSDDDIALNAAIDGKNGAMTLAAWGNGSSDDVGTISTGTAGTVDIGSFRLNRGTWEQVGTTLPAFSADDFNLASSANATFIRARAGDGTIANAYQLFDLYGLQGMTVRDARSNDSADYGVNYQLVSDIDASATVNWNGGAGFAPVNLGGSLDGNGHTIDGLFIDRPGSSAGLISYWSDRAVSDAPDVEIKDLNVTNADVTGSTAGILFAEQSWGTQAAHNLTNIRVSGSVTGTTAGGVAGSAAGNFDGVRGQSTVSNVHADVAVSGGAFGRTGGLFGDANEHLTIVNSSATGTVDGGSYAGGLVGSTYDDVTIRDSYSTVAVTSNDLAGGLVGYASGGLEISNAFNAGNVRGTSAGGLVGMGASSVGIADAYSSGTVTATGGSGYAGGVVGYADRFVDIQTTYATGAVTGATAGGLVGAMQAATTSITNSVWDVETSGQASAVGNAGLGTISNVDGATSAEMKQLSIFTGHGFDVDDKGGTGAIWRIYEGYTAPLLRSFMTGLTITGGDVAKIYDGSATSTDVGTLIYDPAGLDSSLIFGSPLYRASGAEIGRYSGADLTLDGLYSNQFGYDISFAPGTLMIVSPVSPPNVDLERNRLMDAATSGDGSPECDPGVIGDEQMPATYPCNVRYGEYLRAEAE